MPASRRKWLLERRERITWRLCGTRSVASRLKWSTYPALRLRRKKDNRHSRKKVVIREYNLEVFYPPATAVWLNNSRVSLAFSIDQASSAVSALVPALAGGL